MAHLNRLNRPFKTSTAVKQFTILASLLASQVAFSNPPTVEKQLSDARASAEETARIIRETSQGRTVVTTNINEYVEAVVNVAEQNKPAGASLVITPIQVLGWSGAGYQNPSLLTNLLERIAIGSNGYSPEVPTGHDPQRNVYGVGVLQGGQTNSGIGESLGALADHPSPNLVVTGMVADEAGKYASDLLPNMDVALVVATRKNEWSLVSAEAALDGVNDRNDRDLTLSSYDVFRQIDANSELGSRFTLSNSNHMVLAEGGQISIEQAETFIRDARRNPTQSYHLIIAAGLKPESATGTKGTFAGTQLANSVFANYAELPANMTVDIRIANAEQTGFSNRMVISTYQGQIGLETEKLGSETREQAIERFDRELRELPQRAVNALVGELESAQRIVRQYQSQVLAEGSELKREFTLAERTITNLAKRNSSWSEALEQRLNRMSLPEKNAWLINLASQVVQGMNVNLLRYSARGEGALNLFGETSSTQNEVVRQTQRPGVAGSLSQAVHSVGMCFRALSGGR